MYHDRRSKLALDLLRSSIASLVTTAKAQQIPCQLCQVGPLQMGSLIVSVLPTPPAPTTTMFCPFGTRWQTTARLLVLSNRTNHHRASREAKLQSAEYLGELRPLTVETYTPVSSSIRKSDRHPASVKP